MKKKAREIHLLILCAGVTFEVLTAVSSKTAVLEESVAMSLNMTFYFRSVGTCLPNKG